MSERGSIDEALLAVREGLQRRMRGILHSHRIPPQDAEDLVQTALAAMVAGWDDILEPRVWLCGTLRNCCLAYWRARRAHAARFEELDGLELDRGSESERARRDLLIDLDRVVTQLPAGHRRLLVLRFRLGLGSEEAARAMGFAGDSVRQTVRRSVARLRAAVQEAPPVGTPRRRTRGRG